MAREMMIWKTLHTMRLLLLPSLSDSGPAPCRPTTWAGWFRLTEEKSHYQDRDLWYDSQIQDNWYTSMIIPVGLEVISFGRAMVRKALTHRDQQSAQFGVSLVRQDDTLLHY